jgi:putative redox protein
MKEVEETIGSIGSAQVFCAQRGDRLKISVGAFLLHCNIGPRPMECTIDWLAANGMAFSAETGSGHLITMDGAPDGGGRNLAPRPMETVLAGTGACAAYDVVLILKRGRHDVRSCRLQVTSERAPEDPKVFTKIHLHFIIGASGVPTAAVERAIALSHDRYCSATIMLAKTAAITTSYALVPRGEDQT